MTKVILGKLQAKSNGNIESVVSTQALKNGALVALGDAIDHEKVNATAPAADKELLLVAAPEVKYDETLDQLDIETPAGTPVRAYHLTEGDKFEVEVALFAAAPAVNDIVTGNATHGYAVVGAEGAKTTFVVEALTTKFHDARPMARLRVLTV